MEVGFSLSLEICRLQDESQIELRTCFTTSETGEENSAPRFVDITGHCEKQITSAEYRKLQTGSVTTCTRTSRNNSQL